MPETEYEFKLIDENEKQNIRNSQLRDIERQLFSAKVNMEGAPEEQREQFERQYMELRGRAERLWNLFPDNAPANRPAPNESEPEPNP